MDENGYRALARMLKDGGGVTRRTFLDGENLGNAQNITGTAEFFLSEENGEPRTGFPFETEWNGSRVLMERFSKGKILLICGGGHVSKPVSMLGKLLGYRVLVTDDRPEFASEERFPDADEVACGEFLSMLSRYDWSGYPDTSVVIVTRGHAADTDCLRAVVCRDLPYIGMIGSGEGVPEAQLARVHAPIGLPIGGQTPEEIAVSIAAELIAERKDCGTSTLSESMLDALCSETSAGGIMATVVRKTGSAPRGTGARMLMLPSGAVIGTVGGGLAEYEVTETARRLLKHPHPLLRHFDMANGEAGKSGLICGGAVDVLFEVVT